MEPKYDIFISYRRAGGAQFARILQLMLSQRGYKVFLDYDELTDGKFGEHIKEAIKEAPIFMLVLSAHALDRCKNEDDWVRQELLQAIEQGKKMVPVNPDNTFDGLPDSLPQPIAEAVGAHQYSDINFGQTLGVTIDFMVEKRIAPLVGKRTAQDGAYADGEVARHQLRQQDEKARRHRQRKRMLLVSMAILSGLLLIGGGCMLWHHHQTEQTKKALMVETALDGQHYLNWSADITMEQLEAVNEILDNMVPVYGGTFMMGPVPDERGEYDEDVMPGLETPPSLQAIGDFWMNQYEVSVSEWHRVMGTPYDVALARRPMTGVSLTECRAFAQLLADLTGFDFALPTEAEWEFAARGGLEGDDTKYAGKDQLDKVGWYEANSSGRTHERNDADGGLYPNELDLFDMSGNVSEWCDTPFQPYDSSMPVVDANSYVIRGGAFDSEAYETTVYHRDPMNADAQSDNVGLRLIIHN